MKVVEQLKAAFNWASSAVQGAYTKHAPESLKAKIDSTSKAASRVFVQLKTNLLDPVCNLYSRSVKVLFGEKKEEQTKAKTE